MSGGKVALGPKQPVPALKELGFTDFGTIYEEMLYENDPVVIDGEKLKASVRWMHYADSKWVLSIRSMEALNVLKKTISTAKLLLLPLSKTNQKTIADACDNAKPWTYETFRPLNEKSEDECGNLYTCFEGVATERDTPYILKRAETEETTCLCVGLYTKEKTHRKRYQITISELIIIDTKADTIYNMKNVNFEGDYEP